MGLAIVETAGGVLSPGPSGTPQADIFRPMRLPAILVGDHRLGGIAATISAAESLIMRGYDLDAVVCFQDNSKYGNAQYLEQYFKNLSIPTFTLPWIPNLDGIGTDTRKETNIMKAYYQDQSQSRGARLLSERIVDRHSERLAELESMASRTKKAIWHPFTQHKHLENAADILVFDSAYGDYFQVKETGSTNVDAPLLYPAFDGSASWWTQGFGHGNPKLALAAAYAAGRYGHIMFAGATHQPALTLAEKLLAKLGNPRLKKVFYTDNGSTATEVGLKMALRASCKRYDWDHGNEHVGVLGLKGSYHGDTIGAMDASEPCVFNEKVDWYRGRGYWFDYPTFKMKKGEWFVEPPAGMEESFGPAERFEHQDDIFDLNARGRSLRYESYIEETLDKLVRKQGQKFGGLIMEPVILGAGGMVFVDPLFQQSLVRVVRCYNFAPTDELVPPETNELSWSGLPVVFDEVFTGLHRLGRFSSATFLDVHPDITMHAKLLTGGLLPLSITTASESIFKAFWGDEKSEALLHGHSYTAHAVGCQVANVSLDAAQHASESSEWKSFQEQWNKFDRTQETVESTGATIKEAAMRVTSNQSPWSMWSKAFVNKVSKHERVEFVNALGSVFAASLVDRFNSGGIRIFSIRSSLICTGYNSSASTGLRDALLSTISEGQTRIHSRVLGNVIYLMASITAKPAHLADVEKAFLKVLDQQQ
jgi:dethiobiotin synthetase/adenosylmethionine--8-amino-7-oxononanoate aminotransferase